MNPLFSFISTTIQKTKIMKMTTSSFQLTKSQNNQVEADLESQISAFIAIEDLGDDSDDECEEC